MQKQSKPVSVLLYFGSQVAHWRRLRGLTQEQLAAEVDGYGLPTLRSVEQGTRVAHPDLIVQLERILDANGSLLAGGELLREVKYPQFFGEQASLEADCLWLNSYEMAAVPGLLQTEEYARAVISARCPPLDDDEIERRVQARIDRQVLLTRRPAAILSFVIEEAALRRPLGGREVLRQQLYRILEISALRNVTIQVMPTDVEEHTGLDGPMVLLETADQKHLAYAEGQLGGESVADPERVRTLGLRYGIIRAGALTASASSQLIKTISGEL